VRTILEVVRAGRPSISAVTVAAVPLSAGLALLVFRHAYTGHGPYDFLAWNAFLAGIPYALASLVEAGHRRRLPWHVLGVGVLAWLLFLPNALYIVTDFVHLGDIRGMPVWFDAAMIGTFACGGLLLGFASLHRMQCVVRGFGSAPAWLFTIGALALSTVGIYLGRVLQLNSWDALVRPGHVAGGLLSTIADPDAHSGALVKTALLGTALVVSYLAAYRLSRRDT
jgi:uncharacterized membrane protein